MEYAEVAAEFIDQEEHHAIVDKTYNWQKQNDMFTPDQIKLMKEAWLETQKEFYDNLVEVDPPIVHRHQLNRLQKFAFDIIQDFKNKNKQLLMIINGGAGSGILNIVKT